MKKNGKKKLIIGIAAAVVIIFILILLFVSGIFKKEPVVEVQADNCYKETLHVVTDEDYRPYSFYSKNGKYSGHDVELITLIANKLNMNLDLWFMPWDKAIDTVTSGKAEILMTCDFADSFEGSEQLVKSEPVSSDRFIVYSKNKLSSSDELYSKNIAVTENANVLTQLEMLNLTGNCIAYKNNREAMQAVADGEVDCAVMRNTVGSMLLKEGKLRGITGYISIGESYMCFGISDPKLLRKVNAAIEELKNSGEMERLNDKWLTTFVEPYKLSEVLISNWWIIVVFFLLVIALVLFYIRDKVQKRKMGEQKAIYLDVVENLTNDFESVIYINDYQEKPEEGLEVRTSDIIKNNIPDWDEAKTTGEKMELICNSIVVPEDRERFSVMTKRRAVIRRLDADQVHFVNFNAVIDGEQHYYQVKYSAVPDTNGKLKGCVIGIHNIDDDSERESETGSRAAAKAKTDFLLNMSHDIRTPMNAILGFTQIAQKNVGDQYIVSDCLAKVQTAGDFLLSLLNDVLDISKIEQGKLTLDEEEVILPDVLISLEDFFRESAEEKQLKLSFDCDEMKEDTVWADHLHLSRVMMNIISNAIKYTRVGGQVDVSLKELDDDNNEAGTYVFTVEDNGIGMSQEFVEHIFEQFSRERNSTSSGIQGTGLGMAITKNLVDLMNGSIAIDSELGKGTKVTITFPFRYYKDVHHHDEIDDVIEAGGIRLDGMRVLLVEDNLLNREIAIDILNDLGVVAEEAEDGAIAVKKVSESKPGYYDLVLMDIQMPYMDGYQATNAIRSLEDQELANIPIIALSANVFPEDKRKSYDMGMDGHLGKPLDMAELIKVLMEYAPEGAGIINSDEEEFIKADIQEQHEEKQNDNNKFTILITDDSEINRRFLRRMLQEKYNIVEAENGKEALDKLRDGETKVHLIMLDLSMPVMTGFEFMEEWKSDPELSEIPVMVETAGTSTEGEVMSLRLGAADFVKRPYQSEIILHRVANVLKNKYEITGGQENE